MGIRSEIEVLIREKRYFQDVSKPVISEKPVVIIMVYSLYGGGAERVACILASGLSQKYHVCLVFYQDKEKSYEISDDVELIKIPVFNGQSQKVINKCTRYIRKLKNARNAIASISLMYFMNRLNAESGGCGRVICCERNNPLKREPEHMDEIRKIYERADHVIFQTGTVQSLFGEEITSHSSIIKNPVSVSLMRKKPSKKSIISIGRLNPQKNHELLIRAFAIFLETHHEYILEIFGDGELKESLKRLAENLGISHSVVFHGNVENVHEKAADAGMFVLSSEYEGLPNALLECMMMGLPCISTDCEGSRDVIKDRVNGILVKRGNIQQLAEAMSLLADNEELCDKLGKAAGESACEFRTETVLEQWEKLIIEN